jgi:hypothetical protein
VSTTAADSEQQRKLYAGLKSILGPVMGGAIAEIAAVADFELSDEARRPFVEFVHWVNARPAFIARWRADPISENRDYPRFMTVTDGARSAYAAACYHLGRLTQIETAVNAVLSRYDFTKQLPPNSVAAIGRMRQLDFEYHAFVIAYKRCLDYLAWGLSTYFRERQNSYKRFGEKTLASAHPSTVAAALKVVYDRHSQKFGFVMGDERGKSLRDRIGHSEFVQAAAINVDANGHRFVGGGENLRLSNPTDNRSLSEILHGRAADLHTCISDFLTTFRIAVTALPENPANME